jgi:hypothetical protein
MPTSVKHDAAWKSVTNAYVKPGGTWLEALGVWRNHGGNWTKVHGGTGGGFTQFTITGFSPSSGGTSSRLNNGQLSTAPAVQTTGGSGAFTYAWSVIADDSGGTLSNSTSQSCSFSTGSQTVPTEKQTTLRCVVTDTGDGGRTQQADFVRNWIWGAI